MTVSNDTTAGFDAERARKLADGVLRVAVREWGEDDEVTRLARTLLAALAEIARLKRERDHYRSNADWVAQENRINGLLIKIERLQEALREIANNDRMTQGLQMRDIARAALDSASSQPVSMYENTPLPHGISCCCRVCASAREALRSPADAKEQR